jgi:hypothetical protein
MNKHPPFCQRNEWTPTILSKEWMNIQHFIKGMDEHPAFYQNSEKPDRGQKYAHNFIVLNFKRHIQTDWDIYHASAKSMGPPNLRPWFGTYCSTKGGNRLDSSNILKTNECLFLSSYTWTKLGSINCHKKMKFMTIYCHMPCACKRLICGGVI